MISVCEYTNEQVAKPFGHRRRLCAELLRARLSELGGTVLLAGSRADFGKHIADEKWSKVVRFASIKPE
jgi:hypothetical protein